MAPDLDFAGGLLGGFQKKVADERARKDANNQFIVSTLINSGRVKDINDLAPFLGDLGSRSGSGGGKGKSGGAGKAGNDPMSLIGMLVNPIFKKHAEKKPQQQGGGAQPGGGDQQPQQPQGANISGRSVGLMSEAEARQQAETDAEAKLKRETQSKIDIEKAKPQTIKWTPGTVAGDQLPKDATDIYGKPIDPKQHYAQGTDASGQPIFVPREASAGQQSRDAKAHDLTTFTGYGNSMLEDAEKAAGHPLSNPEKRTAIDAAFKQWMADHNQLTVPQKLDLARERAKIMQTVGVPSQQSVLAEAQTIKLGDSDKAYVNIDGFTGEKSKNAAREEAVKNGVTPVTKSQADQLVAANTALGNLNEFYATLSSKMPANAQGRPLASVEIPLKQFFQTDEELAAAVSWNITVLPQLRAMNVTGRVPVFEYQQALAAQPKLTDTVGTAAKKLAIVRGTLERGAKSILDRPLAAGGRGAGGGGDKPKADPAQRTRARQALLTAGKQADDATIDLFLKNNPTFK